MDVYTLKVLTIDVSTKMGTFVYHQTLFASFMRKVSERSPKQPRANYQIIVFFHYSNFKSTVNQHFFETLDNTCITKASFLANRYRKYTKVPITICKDKIVIEENSPSKGTVRTITDINMLPNI